MSEIYAVLGDNYELIKEVEKSYESTEDVRLHAVRIEMGKLATKHVAEEEEETSIKPDEISHENDEDIYSLHKIKYLPLTKPKTVRQKTYEEPNNVVNIEAEQRSFGICFVNKSIEQNNATLIVPRNRNKQAFLKVFDPDEI